MKTLHPDYENEYANLILKHNLNYETVTSTTDGKIILKNKGDLNLLPTVIESVLKRPIFWRICRHHSSSTQMNGFGVSIES